MSLDWRQALSILVLSESEVWVSVDTDACNTLPYIGGVNSSAHTSLINTEKCAMDFHLD